jgi:hypothetical protein
VIQESVIDQPSSLVCPEHPSKGCWIQVLKDYPEAAVGAYLALHDKYTKSHCSRSCADSTECRKCGSSEFCDCHRDKDETCACYEGPDTNESERTSEGKLNILLWELKSLRRNQYRLRMTVKPREDICLLIEPEVEIRIFAH